MEEDEDDPTQVLERERSGGGGVGGGGHVERSHGIDPRELAPFLNALDQYNPTVCWVLGEGEGVTMMMLMMRGSVCYAHGGQVPKAALFGCHVDFMLRFRPSSLWPFLP